MSCKAAIIDKYPKASPADPVEEILEIMKKGKVETVPVVDEDGSLVGVFSLLVMMKALLPVSVAVSGGVNMDIVIPAAPGIAKRLNKVHMLHISDLMERRVNAVAPQTAIWEALNLLVQGGSPLFVADPKTGRYLGTITSQSALEELNRMKEAE